MCEIAVPLSSPDDFIEWSVTTTEKPAPDACTVAKDLVHQSITALNNTQISTEQAGPAPQLPNLKECEVLSDEVFSAIGGSPQLTFTGSVCRWLVPTPAMDLTRFWFEQGSLDNERKVAEQLNFKVEDQTIAGVPSIVMRAADPGGACGVASDAAGVVGWWISPRGQGVDACGQATKLMERTLAKNP